MTGWSYYGLLTLLHKGGASFCWEVFPLTATNEGTQRLYSNEASLLMSLELVGKVQLLGASSPGIEFSWFVHSLASAVTAPRCLLPAAEPTQLGRP